MLCATRSRISGASDQLYSRWARLAVGVVLSLATVLVLAPAGRGQVTSGTIFGSVQDPTGAVISNATITATDPDKGVTRTATSSGTGSFSIPNLPPGTYSVQVAAQGFGTLTKSGVFLNAADSLNAGA